MFNKNKIKREKYDIGANIIVIFFAICSLFPLYWLVTSSFKNSVDVVKMPPDWFPKSFTLSNYVDVFNNQPAFKWAYNSIVVSLVATLALLIVSAMAAYAFSKLRFKGKNIIFIIFISSLMIPKEVMIVPLFRIIQDFGMVNTLSGMIWPNVATAFGVFLLKGFFDSIPDSLREAAKMDGASEFRIFFTIMLPVGETGSWSTVYFKLCECMERLLMAVGCRPIRNFKNVNGRYCYINARSKSKLCLQNGRCNCRSNSNAYYFCSIPKVLYTRDYNWIGQINL